MRRIEKAGRITAVFTAPPSKAHTLRGLFIASLAEGKSVLVNALDAADQRAAAKALSLFGAEIDFENENFVVEGTGGKPVARGETVFAGDSGVTARFLIPFAALAEGDSVIDGSERMRQRPVGELLEALAMAGVKADSEGGRLPVRVQGKTFLGGTTGISGEESSQHVSAMLVSAPCTQNGLLVKIGGALKSRPYVDITVECMRAFGVNAVNRQYKEFFAMGKQKYKAREYAIEGDYSSASYFFAAAAVTGGKAIVKNLNPYSRQGAKIFLRLLEKMGCKVKHGKNFAEVKAGRLNSISADLGDFPDIVPSLAVVAAFAEGRTVIRNIGHLAHKESDRISAVAENLRNCGVRVLAGKESMEIFGGEPHGCEVKCFSDHRIAMAFSVLGLAVGETVLDEPECVSKSYPGFFAELEKAYG